MKESRSSSNSYPSIVLTAIVTAISTAIVTATYLIGRAINDESVITLGVTCIALIAPFAFALPVYAQLRRRSSSKGSELKTALVVSIALTISFFITQAVLGPWILERITPIGMILGFMGANFVFLFLLSFVGGVIARKIYQTKHSIIVD